jgi:hypothetical protein
MKSGKSVMQDLESAHAKAMEAQRANMPMSMGDGTAKAPEVKKTGTFHGKSNRLGGGGRFAQIAEKAGGGAKGAAIAAAIGRKKYGNKKMSEMAQAGKK